MMFCVLFLCVLVASAQSTIDQNQVVGSLARQLLLQQLYVEEKTRSEGDSGIKQTRHGMEGTRPYFSNTHTLRSVASIHDHSNNIRTVGMGEFAAVLNGIEFRTRHNDYRLNMPHRRLSDYHKVEEIPFPRVPQSVTSKRTVTEQISEMREWFKAWKDGSTSPRDYRRHFKPVLCYLEGAWTTKTSLDEPFESDRHFIDADSWFDLQQKIRFTSNTGSKSNLENFAYLPTTITDIINGTLPVFAQWNYRIMCHPLKRDVPLNRFRPIDDLSARKALEMDMEEFSRTRAVRFQLNPFDTDHWPSREKNIRYGLLDSLMSEIPGKDNYPANLTDDAFGERKAGVLSPEEETQRGVKFNAGYYHRWYKVFKKGAMGLTTRHRGFADEYLFMALNSRPEIAAVSAEKCRKSRKGRKTCTTYSQRWSYAIPLEIIYLTPLASWNPYGLVYKGDHKSELAKTAYSNGRKGGITASTAYDGTTSKLYYQTPIEFFTGKEVGSDPADTTKGSVGVLDSSRAVKKVTASGTRIMLPDISGVGRLRTRWPTMPIHMEGNPAWKELEAMKDIVKEQGQKIDLIINSIKNATNSITGGGGPEDSICSKGYTLILKRSSNTAATSRHTHNVNINTGDCRELLSGKIVEKTTTVDNMHEHTLKLRWRKNKNNPLGVVYMTVCDGTTLTGWKGCWDQHPKNLQIL